MGFTPSQNPSWLKRKLRACANRELAIRSLVTLRVSKLPLYHLGDTEAARLMAQALS